MTDKGSKTRLAELAWPGLACWCVVATYFVYGSAEGVRGDPERWFVVPVLATWLVAIVYAFKSSRAEATKAVRTVSSVMNASATPIVPFMILTQGERLRGLSWIEEQLVSGVVAAAFILVGEGLWKPRSKAGRFVRMIWPAVATGVFYAGMRIVSSDAYVMALEPMRINEAAGAGWFWRRKFKAKYY